MTSVQFQVDSYAYYFWSSRDTGKANLVLKGANGMWCGVWFVEKPEQALPAPEYVAASKYVRLWYRFDQLDQLIDMLRNEAPIFVMYDDAFGGTNCRISTSDEPVGEGERASV